MRRSENIRFGRLSTTKTIEFETVKTILTDGSSPLNGKLCNRAAEITKFEKRERGGTGRPFASLFFVKAEPLQVYINKHLSSSFLIF